MRLVLLLSVMAYMVLGDEEPRRKCPDPDNVSSSHCADAYNLQHCDGDFHHLNEYDSTCQALGSWDNKISSLVVRTGCILTGWEYSDCSGEYGTWAGSEGSGTMGHGWGDDLSS